MKTLFLSSFRSEWLKTRRSAASWLVIAGGFLIPLILLGARLYQFEKLPTENVHPQLWLNISQRAWQYMSMLLLPMGVILITSLVTQTEFRNNTWKQVHTLPQSLTTIFTAKLAVIMVLLLQGFLLFNIGIYLIGAVPALFSGVPYPVAGFPLQKSIQLTGRYIVGCLPIVALQFLLSLQYRNFLIPIGAGFGLYIASMIALNWKHGYIMPYIYSAYTSAGRNTIGNGNTDPLVLASAYFTGTIILGYLLYIHKKDKA